MIFFYELAVYIPYFLECFLLAYLMLHRNEKKAHYRCNMILLLMIGVLWQLPVSALIFIDTPGFEVLFGIVKFLLSLTPLYFFVALYRTRVLSLSYIIILAILFQRWSSVFADIVVGFTPLEEEFFFVRAISWLSYALMVIPVWYFYIRRAAEDGVGEQDGITILLFVLLCRVPLNIAFPLHHFSASLCIPCVFVALAVSVIGVTSSNLISAMLSTLNLQPHTDLYMPTQPVAMVLFGIQLCVITPMIEEFVFRGMIFQSMRRFGDSFALVLSAILFALFHGNLVQAPNAFLMGLVIGYFVLYSGSLWVGVIIHAVNNAMSLVLDLLCAALPEEYQSLFLLSVFALYLVAGIAALLVLVRKYPNMFMFIRSTTFSTERIKYRVAFSSLTMVFALILLVALIIQNMF